MAQEAEAEGPSSWSEPPRLDIGRLQALAVEQQTLHLLTNVIDLERWTTSSTKETLASHNVEVRTAVLQILELECPAPSKAVRGCLGRVLAHCLEGSEGRGLFETVQLLVGVLDRGKGDVCMSAKHAATYLLGETYRSVGRQAIGLSGLVCSTLLKFCKISQNHAGARAAAFGALAKVVASVEDGVDDSLLRDIWKAARKAAVDEKIALVQMRALQCLEALVLHTPKFETTTNFEEIRQVTWKVMGTSRKATRDAAMACLATYLAKIYSEKAVPKNGGKSKIASPEVEPTLVRSDSSTDLRKKLELALSDILLTITNRFTMSATSNKGRIALADCTIQFLHKLGASVCRSQYLPIFSLLSVEILNSPFINHDRRRQILSRKLLCRIMDKGFDLTESARIEAAQSLITKVLKIHFPVVKELPQSSKHVLICALQTLAALVDSLGSAFESVAESCEEALVQLTSHLSYSVQVHTAYCFQRLVATCPHHLLICGTKTIDLLDQETARLDTPSASPRRCVGLANCVAAIISISSQKPLFSSLELDSRLLSTATLLLRSSGQAGLRAAGAQVQVAWILLGSLMSLGPEFVKIHLSQLMLLWRNALSPIAKETLLAQQTTELCYLTSVREYALGCLLTFLRCNERLLTSDICQRISRLLQNSAEFLASLPVKRMASDPLHKIASSLKFQDIVLMIRRRILQCYVVLVSTSDLALASDVFLDAVMTFAEPEMGISGNLATSIQNSASEFDSLVNVGDAVCSSTTSMLSSRGVCPLDFENSTSDDDDSHDFRRAPEHDFTFLLVEGSASPDSPAVELINAAITLFAISFPLQSHTVQNGALAQLASISNNLILQKDPWRRTAVSLNIGVAIYQCLRVFNHETKLRKGISKSAAVDKSLADMLKNSWASDDVAVQRMAASAMGKLCNSAGNAFTSAEVDALINTIVLNREPNIRAGCALALGAIHAEVGGMAVGLHMKKIHGILMSLSNDPQATVHHCAIVALSEVIDSAGLAFAGLIQSTMGLLAQLWGADTHNLENSAVATSNTEIEHSTPAAIARCTRSLIDVLGPDLQSMTKMQDLVLKLAGQFDADDSDEVQVEGLRIWQSLHLYAPRLIRMDVYVTRLVGLVQIKNLPLKQAALDCLHGLMRQDASLIYQVGGKALEEELWLALNLETKIIRIWLEQACLTDLPTWLSRCQQLMTRVSNEPAESSNNTAALEVQDEEVAGFNVAEPAGGKTSQELLGWQVRFIAVDCLNIMVSMVHDAVEHDPECISGKILQQRVADVIRLAFLASTASVLELQIGGLRLIDQILQIYGTTPDPDFAEASLLEQYQAQISSALTPAFAADSSPDLISAAVNVCATFISAGLVTDAERMGRILKLLVTVLENCESGSLSANGQTKIRLAVLSAWAELQINSTSQSYLANVVEPHLAKLTPFWLESLREFARLKFEPDISDAVGLSRSEEALHIRYAAYNRCTLLQFYEDAWLQLVGAIASLIDGKSSLVLASEIHDRNYRQEPATFFYILFGLVIESLIRARDDDFLVARKLSVLKTILKPAVAGRAIFQGVIFSETVELLQRLALTCGQDVYPEIIGIVESLCHTHPTAQVQDETGDLSDDIEQLFELSRILVLILGQIVPSIQDASSRPFLSQTMVSIAASCIEALVSIANVFPRLMQDDLHACLLHVFATVLSSSICQDMLVPRSLPILRSFLLPRRKPELICSFLRQCLQILSVAQRRETSTSLLCAKNVLLTTTITLSTSSHALDDRSDLLVASLDAMIDCLDDLGLAKVAANCLRSLLLLQSSIQVAARLVSRLLHFLLTNDGEMEIRMLLLQALTGYVGDEERAKGPGLPLVASILLLEAKSLGPNGPQQLAPRMLELTGEHRTLIFKTMISHMSPNQRALTEEILKAGRSVDDAETVDMDPEQEPTIALKLDFAPK